MKKDDFLALARLWAKEKKPYLKRSTYAAYSFITKTARDSLQVAKMILDFKDLQSGRNPQPFRLRLPSRGTGYDVVVLTVEEESSMLDHISKSLNPRTFGIWLSLTGNHCGSLFWRVSEPYLEAHGEHVVVYARIP